MFWKYPIRQNVVTLAMYAMQYTYNPSELCVEITAGNIQLIRRHFMHLSDKEFRINK